MTSIDYQGMFGDEMWGEENMQPPSREVPVLSTQLEKESFDTLVNVNSRLAVHSTATASVCRGI